MRNVFVMAVLGALLASAGVTVTDWQLWAILLLVAWGITRPRKDQADPLTVIMDTYKR